MSDLPKQEAAFRDWWDNRRDDELEAIKRMTGCEFAERVAFRAGYLAAIAVAQAAERQYELAAPSGAQAHE